MKVWIWLVMNKFSNSFFVINSIAQGSPEWHDWRKTVIGASDAPKIMGENPFASKKSLLKDKITPKITYWSNAAMNEGNALEPVARKALEKIIGVSLNPQVIQNILRPWQAASVDGVNFDNNIVVEIKCGKASYDYLYKNNKIPVHYYAQLQHILSVLEMNEIIYFAFRPDEKPIITRIKRDQEYIDLLLKREQEFIVELNNNGVYLRDSIWIFDKKLNRQSENFYDIDNKDGSQYCGQISEGVYHGMGSLKLLSGECYEGDWIFGRKSGYGKIRFINGDIYYGQWLDNKMHGKGVYYYVCGDIYKGTFNNNLKSGHGSFHSDLYIYQGDYENGKRKGRGSLTVLRDSVLSSNMLLVRVLKGDIYEGEWLENIMHGYGVMHYSDGSIYKGEFKSGLRCGKGEFTNIKGDKFIGFWKDNVRHGAGRVIHSDGYTYTGRWSKGSIL
jgi:putative phage-type endonuclease